MKKPNFIYIGPPKTGSKWITRVLKSHPKVFVSGIDMYFFDRDTNYSKGIDWYKAFFNKASDSHFAVGELSHDYIYSSNAAKRIAHFNKEMKIIINLRNPVDLCFSVYKAMIKYGETSSSYRNAMLNKEKTHGKELMDYGEYYDNIVHYTNLFDRKNILYLKYDDLVNDKQLFMKKIYNFLGVNNLPELANIPEYNTAKESRLKIFGILAKACANLLRKMNLLSLLRILKNSNILTKFLFKDRISNSLDKNDKIFFKKFYTEDLKKVEKLTGLNLSDWYI